MGSAQDIMQTFASMDIRAVFSEFDGWKCMPVTGQDHCGTLYRISRHIRGNKESAALMVVFDAAMIDESVRQLSGIKSENRENTRKYLLVPKDTDVSAVPSAISIISMHAFGYCDGRLVWLTKKKNAVHYPECMPSSA
ncbi:MAG: hypothetical protein WC391_05195 [Methanoregula sp.]|jgi:hypothetical protein